MSPTSRQRLRIGVWLAIAAGSVTVAAAVLWRTPPAPAIGQPTEDALLAFGLYVDEHSCAECHPTQSASYPQTGHAQTFRPSPQTPLAAALNGKSFPDPERKYAYHYAFDALQGLSVTVPQQLGNDRFPLMYAFGSGQRGVTFLTLIPSRAGETVGVEHRVSVRLEANTPQWQLTPGHAGQTPQQQVEHFGRVIKGEALVRCIECHTTGGEIVGQEIRGWSPGVGCQNCHGPGREHILAMRHAKRSGTVPRKSAPPTAREEIRQCQGCHLTPDAHGEPETPPEHFRRLRFQSRELLQSKCFAGSEDRLSCSTCHDPHAPLSSDAADYERRCRECHTAPRSAACPVSPTTDCVRCHLPTVTAENGIQWHDHRIRKTK